MDAEGFSSVLSDEGEVELLAAEVEVRDSALSLTSSPLDANEDEVGLLSPPC